MRPFPLLFAALALAGPGGGAQAATLRTLTTLSAPVVLLSDLFDDAGAKAARILGPAPAPGERIVVESSQLAAIARQFEVDWRPTSTGDRAVLDRPGKLMQRDGLVAALLAALVRVGAPAAAEIELPGFDAPMVPRDTDPRVAVEQIDYEGTTGHFNAAVLITGDGMTALRLRLGGHVEEIVAVVVPAHRLPVGSVVRAGDLVIAQVRASLLRGDALRDVAQASGMALRRTVPAGQPVQLADLQHPISIVKGAHVTMELRMPGITVLAQGVAQEAGATGDRIQVLNPSSHMLVDADITGTNRVRVQPDSVPAPANLPGVAQVAAQ